MLDDKKKYSLVDRLSPLDAQSTTDTIAPQKYSLVPSTDELLNKLTSLEEEKREKLEKLPPNTTLNYDDGSLTYDVKIQTPKQEVKPKYADIISQQEQMSPLETKTAKFLKKNQLDTGIVDKVKKTQDIIEQVRSIGNSSKLWNSLQNGVYQGVYQNIDLVTGFTDLSTAESAWSLSREQLEQMRNDGYITTEEYSKYLQNRNQLPLLTSVTAAITNSLMLAGEIGYLAPKTAAQFTAKGVSFFTKEGVKKWGKEVVKQGVNSYRALGIGGNIRSVKDTITEVEEQKLTDLDDILAVLGKHALKNNVQSFAEGATEGLISNLKYADVPIKSLFLAEGKALTKAWTTLATNASKKSISGLVLETATEQVSDLVQDITSGNNVFTQGSNFVNILAGETNEIRKQALENLFIEAVTGFAIGTAFGGKDLFRRSVLDKVQDQVNKGVITKEEAESLIEKAEEKASIDKAVEKIVGKNKKSNWSQTTKNISHGLDVFKNFGTKKDPGLVVSDDTKVIHNAALGYVDENMPTITANAAKRIDDMSKDSGIQPNTLDQAIIIGQEAYKVYLDHRGNSENVDYLESFKEDDIAYKMPFEIMHEITEEALSNMQGIASIKGITPNLVIPDGLNGNQRIELQKDLLLLSLTEFEDKGIDLIKAKWNQLLDKEVVNQSVDSALAQRTDAARQIGQRSMSEAMAKGQKRIDDYYGARAMDEMDKRKSDPIRENEEIDSIGQSAADILNQQPVNNDLNKKIYDLHNRSARTKDPSLLFHNEFEKYLDDIANLINSPEMFELGFELDNKEKERILNIVYKSKELYQKGDFASAIFNAESALSNIHERADLRNGYSYFIDMLERDILDQRPEAQSKPGDTNILFPSYADILTDFKGDNVAELFSFLKDKNLVNETLLPVYKLLLKHIGDVKVVFEERTDPKTGKQIPGGYQPAWEGNAGYIIINPKAPAYSNFDTANTALHESLHAYTVEFLRSGTKEAAEFRSDIDAVISEVREVLNNPDKAIANGIWMSNPNELKSLIASFPQEIAYYTGNAEEFIAGVFSDTTKVRGMLMRIKATAQLPSAKITLWDKVRNAFKNAWSQILPTDQSTLFDSLIDIMSKHQATLDAFNRGRRKDLGLTTNEIKKLRELSASFHGDTPGFYLEDEMKELDTERNQEDDDSIEDLLQDAATAKGLISLVSELENIPVPDLRKKIKDMGTREAFERWLTKEDAKFKGIINKRIIELYDTLYKKKQEDPARFRARFITGAFNSIINTKSMPHLMVRTDRTFDSKTRRQSVTTTVVKLGDTFKNGDGSTADSYVGEVILEGFLEPLAKLLGLPKDIFQLHYIASYEAYRDNQFEQRSTLGRMSKWLLGDKDYKGPKSRKLSQIMFNNGYIYLGNFGGRNTSPVLFVPEQYRKAVFDKFNKVAEQYGNTVNNNSQYGQAARLLLEDLWLGSQAEKIEDIKAQSKVLKENINKVWKRGMKFLTKINSTWQNPLHLQKILGGKKLHGIAMKNGQVTMRTAVFNSNDDGTVTIKVNGEILNIPIKSLLKNSTVQETERTDGASFYLFGELDEIYHEIHGTMKDGTIKNVYASSNGEKPLYIKHAMHGVHAESLLGQFMRKHNVALLISDTSAKISPAQSINLSEYSEGTEVIPKDNIMELELGKFQRIKEELGTNTVAGTIKQWLNGSGHGSYSSVIKSADVDGNYDNYLKALANTMVTQAQKELLEQAQPKALLGTFRTMVERPNSPREELISKAFKSIARLSDNDFFNNFGNVFNFPMIAESLRQRLFSTLSTALQGRVGGMRLALRPDPGALNTPAGYDLIAATENLNSILISTMVEDGIVSKIYPEAGLGQLVLDYLDTQRMQSLANTRQDFKKVKELKAEREAILDKIMAIAELDTTTNERKKVFLTSGGNVYRLMDKTNPDLEKWRQQKLDKIVNKGTLTLTEDWSVIPEDYANQMGLKVGDYFIANVTPTDSPLGIIAGRVAAIAPSYKGRDAKRKVADRMSIMMNSEYIQSIVGKDFDIDTISLISFDPTYWTKDQFIAVWRTIKQARSLFVNKVAAVTRAELSMPDLTNEEVFTGPVREQFMQEVMGKTDAAGFDAIEKFWELNDAYLVDPSKIITERLYHTALSAINFRTSIYGRQLNLRHPKWFTTHLAHLIDTNFSVDFPGQLSKLTYVGPDTELPPGAPQYHEIMHGLIYGTAPMDSKESLLANKVVRFLFSTAFDLAAGRDLAFGTKPDYYRLKQQIIKQQNILKLLDENSPQSRLALLDLFNETLDKDLKEKEDLYGNTHDAYDQALAEVLLYKEIAVEYIGNMEVEDVSKYPLFTSILSIDTDNLPMPGSSYEDWLIDQNLLAQDMVKGNAKLTKVLDDQILENADKTFKGTFTQGKTFIEGLAWNIIKFTGIKKDPNKNATQTVDDIVSNPEKMEELRNKVNAQNYGKMISLLQEFSALRSLVGLPYPVDAIRDGKNWDVTHQSIALSLLPKELDFAVTRNKMDLDNNLEGAQAEIIAILHGFEEVVSSGEMANRDITTFWHGREVSFPMLTKLTLSKPKITTKNILEPIELSWKGKKVTVTSNARHQLVFKIGEDHYTHDALLKAREGDAADLYQDLVNRNGMFEGRQPNATGLKNRQEWSRLINFSDNTKPDERMALLEDYIQSRLYSAKSKFTNTERQGLWISFFGQATNIAMRDNKLQGLNIRRDYYDEQDALNYRANEILYELLSRFEPQLFNRAMIAYNDVTATSDRINRTIGIQATRKSSLSVPLVLDQGVFDESEPKKRSNITFDLLSEEIKEVDKDVSYSDLKKAIKEKGYEGGINYIRTMVSNTQIKHALASSDIWYGDLVRDIRKSTPAQFTQKYGPDGLSKIHEVIKQQVLDLQSTEAFIKERIIDQGNDIAAIKAVYFQLKAIDKLASKVDGKLKGTFKKMIYGKLSYNLIAPIKEKKVYAFAMKNAIIGQAFSYDGVKDLKIQDMETFNKSYSTGIYEGVGESSIAIRKSQEINMALNRHHAELGGEISSMENLFKLILDVDERKKFMKQEATTENVARLDLLKQILPELDVEDSNILLLRKEIFLLAENLTKETGVEVGLDELGRVIYRRGDYFGYDKYAFLAGITSPRAGLNTTEFPPMNPLEKIKLLAALDIRELYDVKVPQLLKKGLGYIDRARLDLIASNDLETIIELDAIRERYLEYLNAITRKAGTYMPHMFATETYKFLWANKYRDYIVNKLKKENPTMDYDSEDFGNLVMKAVDSAYSKEMVGEASNYTIPNFLPRRNPEDDSYKKATLDMHYQYVGQLITGLKHDLLYTDWLLYRNKARAHGERTSILELTRLWYADQMRNKMMHTKDLSTNDLKSGMQINFLKKGFTYDSDSMMPVEGELQVWGVIDKVDKKTGTVTLKLDREKIKFDTENDLDRAKEFLDKIGPERGSEPASDKQVFHIKSMVKKGFLKPDDIGVPLNEITRLQALELNVKGLTKLLKNINILGVYNINELYSKDINGENKPKVNRYTRRGSLEYLDMKRREADNLRNAIGEFDNSVDKLHYAKWVGATWAGNMVSIVPKTIMALLTMGMVTAPNAFMTNWMGALISNHTDAPYTNFWKYRREGKAEWKGFQGKSRDAMNASQKQWYDLFTSLGLASNKDLVAISLEAGNISMLDVLSDKGFRGGLSYLAGAIKSGAEYGTYFKIMDDYRRQYLVTDSEAVRMTLLNKMNRETQVWQAKVERRIKSYVKETTPTKENIETQRKNNPNATEAQLKSYARSQKLIDISNKRAEDIQKEKEAGTYKDVTNIAVEEQMDRKASTKTLGRFLGRHFVTGYLGLGLQALAEVQRRPAFYIGYQTALDLGYSQDEAIQYGVASVEYRHAFYGPSYRQFDANTKLGAFLQQYAQYSWNNFGKWFTNIRQAIPQALRIWERSRQEGKGFTTTVWNMILKRHAATMDEMGKPQLSRNPSSKKTPLEEVNILHRLLSKHILNMMINQAGSRLFYGITGWTDPMTQIFYKFTDLLTDKVHPESPDDDDESTWETLALIGEAFFFLGLPYKLMMQYIIKQPDEDIADTYWRGRLEDQTEFVERVRNEIRIIDGSLTPAIAKVTNQKRFYDVNWLVEDFGFGFKSVGWAYPDSPNDTYKKWGYFPEFNATFPFLHFERQARDIRIKNRARYIDTNNQGIDFGDRMNRLTLEFYKSLFPHVDKLFDDYKPTK